MSSRQPTSRELRAAASCTGRTLAWASALLAVMLVASACGTFDTSRFLYVEGSIVDQSGTLKFSGTTLTVHYPSRLSSAERPGDSPMSKQVTIGDSGEFFVGIGKLESEFFVILPALSPSIALSAPLSPDGVQLDFQSVGAPATAVSVVINEVDTGTFEVQVLVPHKPGELVVSGRCVAVERAYGGARYRCDIEVSPED